MSIPYLIPILGFIFVFGLVVLVHEVGHFSVAKACDVEVEAFSIGMGPSLSYQWGETDYRLSLIPLGGYVSMAGEESMEEAGDNPRAFYNQSVGNRLMILLAGVVFNFLLGYLVYVFMGMFVGEPKLPPKIGYVSKTIEVQANSGGDGPKTQTVSAPAYGKLQVGDRILKINDYQIDRWQDIQVRSQLLGDGPRTLTVKRNDRKLTLTIDPIKVQGKRLNQPRYIMGVQPYHPPRLDRLKKGGNARKLGFRTGDRLVQVNERTVKSWEQFLQYLRDHPGEHQITLEREGKRLTKTISVPETTEEFVKWLSNMGWSPPIKVQDYGIIESFGYGFHRTVRIIRLMYETVVGLILQRVSMQSLAGPVGIAQLTGQISQQGFFNLVYFTAFLSINLGVINLLPIPVLDGGHILMTLPELLTGNPLPERIVSGMNYLGLILLLTFFVYITKIDLCRYEWFTTHLPSLCQ